MKENLKENLKVQSNKPLPHISKFDQRILQDAIANNWVMVVDSQHKKWLLPPKQFIARSWAARWTTYIDDEGAQICIPHWIKYESVRKTGHHAE